MLSWLLLTGILPDGACGSVISLIQKFWYTKTFSLETPLRCDNNTKVNYVLHICPENIAVYYRVRHADNNPTVLLSLSDILEYFPPNSQVYSLPGDFDVKYSWVQIPTHWMSRINSWKWNWKFKWNWSWKQRILKLFLENFCSFVDF